MASNAYYRMKFTIDGVPAKKKKALKEDVTINGCIKEMQDLYPTNQISGLRCAMRYSESFLRQNGSSARKPLLSIRSTRESTRN
jgi:hypothetical protein